MKKGLDHWIVTEKKSTSSRSASEHRMSVIKANRTPVPVPSDLEADLTSCQKDAIKHLVNRDNVFLSGQAGTGKTHLLKRFCEWCLLQDLTVGLTATTGVAAYIIGGKTVFSWASIGLGEEPVEQLIDKISRSSKAKLRWCETDVLIIDEISMMKPELLEKLELIARRVRHRSAVFGGLQVILVGDFYQLPPVYHKGERVKLCFETPCWNRILDSAVVLETIVRQSEVPLQKCLTEAREGSLSPESQELLQSRVEKDVATKGIQPSLLFPYRNTVDMLNQRKLKKLITRMRKQSNPEIHQYKQVVSLQRNGTPFQNPQTLKMATDMSKNLPVQNPSVLCTGCQVMLLVNLDCEKGLVNGSRGVVRGFSSEEGNYPIVEFISGEKITIEPYDWKIKMDFGVEAVVRQIPIALAWAVTIHKSQGASVDLAEIDVGSNIFEYGQAYVALSRVRSIDGLRLLRFDPSSIKANPKVQRFYQAIKKREK